MAKVSMNFSALKLRKIILFWYFEILKKYGLEKEFSRQSDCFPCMRLGFLSSWENAMYGDTNI